MNERRLLNYKDFLNRRPSFLSASEGSGPSLLLPCRGNALSSIALQCVGRGLLYQFALLATHVRRCREFVTPIQALDSTRIYNAINPAQRWAARVKIAEFGYNTLH